MSVQTISRTGWWERALENREAFEEQCRQWHPSQGSWATVLGGLNVRVDPNDTSVCPHLQRDGFWESWVSLAIARAVQPGWRCIDVGAHVGYYTVLMGDRVGDDGEVAAFEPQPSVCKLLRETVEAMPGFGCQVICSAAGVGRRTRTLYQYGALTGSASLWPAKGWTPDGAEQVNVCSLDEILGREPWDFIKVDVEGAEEEVWLGSVGIRQANPRIIVAMEVASNRHYALATFLEGIEKEGYPLQLIAGDGSIQSANVDAIVDRGEELPVLWLQRQ